MCRLWAGFLSPSCGGKKQNKYPSNLPLASSKNCPIFFCLLKKLILPNNKILTNDDCLPEIDFEHLYCENLVKGHIKKSWY
jgi:hypothetical protein